MSPITLYVQSSPTKDNIIAEVTNFAQSVIESQQLKTFMVEYILYLLKSEQILLETVIV